MSQVIEFESSTGSTLASKLFASGSDIVVATASAVTEATNRKGVFTATFSGVTIGTYRILSTESASPDSAWWVDITAADGVFVAYELSKPASQPIIPNGIVQRSVSDTNPLTFAWPVSGATITGEASIDNGSYAAVQGAIAFLRSESGKHYYTLAHDVDDRPIDEGQVRYKFVDGTYTRYIVLQTEVAVLNSSTQGQINDIESDVHNLNIATALISGTTLPAILEDTGTTLPSQIDSVKAKTDLLVTFPANFSSLGINGSGHISRVVLVDTTTTNTDLVSAATIATAVFTTTMTEAYPTNSAEFTLAQGLYLMYSTFAQFSINGTTVTCKKLDGTTTSAIFDLDSATPTSRVRSS